MFTRNTCLINFFCKIYVYHYVRATFFNFFSNNMSINIISTIIAYCVSSLKFVFCKHFQFQHRKFFALLLQISAFDILSFNRYYDARISYNMRHARSCEQRVIIPPALWLWYKQNDVNVNKIGVIKTYLRYLMTLYIATHNGVKCIYKLNPTTRDVLKTRRSYGLPKNAIIKRAYYRAKLVVFAK